MLKNSSAVKVTNLTYAYTKYNVILDNCSINVTCGNIYALLGASGCGKTTLLRCVLGRLTPQEGNIKIFGNELSASVTKIPGSGVGYMPQELALSPELTIEETLMYFGQLHQMSFKDIKRKIKYFINLFDLKDKTGKIVTLSGGQQRRVSLAVAVLHSPPLLILDEPTVGVDPIVRQNIWNYLHKISSTENIHPTTVIITTHYIEEARNALIVGLMRNGKLLEEANPDVLMKQHQCNTLEDIFFKLCQSEDAKKVKSDKTGHSIGHMPRKTYHIRRRKRIERLKKVFNINYLSLINFFQITVLLKYHYKKLSRNWIITLYYLMFPSFQMILYYNTYGGTPQNVPIAIVNDEASPDLSLQFLSTIPKNLILQQYYHNLTSAINAVKSGHVWSAIHFKSNYSVSLEARLEDSTADNESISNSNIHLYMDQTNPVISLSIFHYMVKSVEDLIKFIFSHDKYNSIDSSIPYHLEVIYGEKFGTSITQFSSPGMTMSAVFYMALIHAGHSLMYDRTEGILDRNLVSGVSIIDIIVAHLIIQMSMGIVLVPIVMFTTYTMWRVPFVGNYLEGCVLLFLQSTTGTTLGFLMATFCSSVYHISLMSVAVMMPISFTCGIFWPIESMPKLAQRIVHLVPLTLALDSFRSIAIRGWTLWSSWSVMLGFIASGSTTVIFLVTSIIIFKWITSS